MPDSPRPESAPRTPFRVGACVTVVAFVLVLAAAGTFLDISLRRGRGVARQVHCVGNLKMIYGISLNFSNKKGSGYFPIAQGPSPRAHESLKVLVAHEGEEGLPPVLFFCSESDAVPAEADRRTGHYVLTEGNVSYAWTAQPLKETGRGNLASDKYVDGFEDSRGVHTGHLGGMNVLAADGAVNFVKDSELPLDTKLPQGLTR